MMRGLVAPGAGSRTMLRKLGLSNNLLGDDLIKQLTDDVFKKLTGLHYIDISANKMADDSVNHFFRRFVAGHSTLKGI